MTPKEAITKAMRERMWCDYAHDLPDDQFWIDADAILDGLKDAGFIIVPVAEVHRHEELQADTQLWLNDKRGTQVS